MSPIVDSPQKPEQTDEALALEAQNGGLEAFDILLGRYYQKILRYGHKFLLGRTDIEDVAQEIFIKAYRYIKSFDPERKFSPWIYRIAHNEFINLGKKRKTELVDFFDFDAFFPHPESKENVAKNFEAVEIKALLEQCLNELSDKYKEPMVLYYLEGLDYKDIAEILRIPVATVGVRINRAKKKLKEVSVKFKDKL